MSSFGDDNSLLSTTVYGEFIVADVPAGFDGFTGNVYIPQYSYAQFDRNVSVFGNIYCRLLQGFTTDSTGNITGTGNLALNGTNVTVNGDLICSAGNLTTLVPANYGNIISLQSSMTSLTSTVNGKTTLSAVQSNNNTWSGSNSFNSFLPTSTCTPSNNSDLTTKTYVDTQVATKTTLSAVQSNNNSFSGSNSFTSGSILVPTPATNDNSQKAANTAWVLSQGYTTSSGSSLLGANNTWSGTNTYNTSLPQSSCTPSNNSDLTTKTYVDTQVATKTTLSAVQSNNNSFSGTNSFTSGSISVTTQSSGDNSTYAASTAFVKNQNYLTSGSLSGYVTLSGNNSFSGTNSFTSGSISVTTQSSGDNSTLAASTAYVKNQGYTTLSNAQANPYFTNSASVTGYVKTTTTGGKAGFVFDVGNVVSVRSDSGADYTAGCANGFTPGTGDGASDSLFNVAIRSWYGVAMVNTSDDGQSGTNRVKHYWNARSGDYTAKGSISAGSINSGKVVITESTGTVASATDGTLVIKHDNSYGSSSITFPSKKNWGGDYAYIQYSDNYNGENEDSKFIFGTENDTGSDYICLYPCAGAGRVGVNTYTPSYSLDVTGTFRVSSNAYLNSAVEIANSNLHLHDNSIYLRGTIANPDSNHYIKYVSSRDGPAICGYAGISFLLQGTEIAYLKSDQFTLLNSCTLNLCNPSYHNVQVANSYTRSSDSTVEQGNWSQAVNNYVLTSNNLLLTFDTTNFKTGMQFFFCNTSGSSMRFTIKTGLSSVICERDNNNYGSGQTFSLTNTRRIQFIWDNNTSKLLETFRYP